VRLCIVEEHHGKLHSTVQCNLDCYLKIFSESSATWLARHDSFTPSAVFATSWG
jgi:hypothetical protein